MDYFDRLYQVMTLSGRLVMEAFGKNFEIFEKNDGSFVTSVDIKNELFLKKELLKIVPQASFIAEESGSDSLQKDFVWVIDPLDGTKNFIKGIPHFCIMVALMHKGDLIVSAIYQPVTQDFYYAQKGKGAWMKGRIKINSSAQKFDSKGVIVVIDDHFFKQLKNQSTFHISNRYFGSAGMDAVYLAMGSIDFVLYENIAWWDVAAGILLMQEVDGLQYQYDRLQAKKGFGKFCAGKSALYQEFLAIIQAKICN